MRVFSIFISNLLTILAFSQIEISGYTLNEYTNLPADSVCVILMRDSMGIDSTYSNVMNVNGRQLARFNFHNVAKGEYTLRFIHSKYVVEEQTLNLTRERSTFVNLDFTFLTPIPKSSDQHLGGTTIRATRIKMLYKGDTLVYDADAFQLAKGSMLEALIDELPGAQLKDDGQIFVNGRKVEELLLNGKDFFSGDRLVLLENMPAYMVKNIKVYEREDPFLYTQQKKKYSMDVILKKQYQQGWLANAEAAYGTDSRYLARLFGLRYTGYSCFSAFVNLNNINDNRKPGRGGDWQSQGGSTGRLRTIKGGVDFRVQNRDADWFLETTNEVISNHTTFSQQETGVSFLPTNDVYRINTFNLKGNNTLWKTNNRFSIKFGRKRNQLFAPFSTTLLLNMSYREVNNTSSFRQIEHSLLPDTVSLTFDDLRRDLNESGWYNLLLNTTSNINSFHNYDFNSEAKLYNTARLSAYDELSLDISYKYRRQSSTNYMKRQIDYPSDVTKVADAFHRFTRTPNTDYSLNGSLSYFGRFRYVILRPYLSYTHSYSSIDRSLFNLSNLWGWELDSDRSLRSLPSTRDSLHMCRDAVNSYFSRTYQDNYTIGIEPQKSEIKLSPTVLLSYDIILPLELIHTRLHYQRNTIDATERRTKVLFNPAGWTTIKINYDTEYRLNFSKNTTLPSLVYRLNITDTSDPLNTTLGNDYLKNPTSYYLGFSFSRNNLPHYGSVSTSLNYSLVRHALAQGFLYDTTTGIRTTRPDNVNGNWNITGKTDYFRSFLKGDALAFESHASYGYLHSVDLTGTTQIERSVVHNVYANEEISMKYKIGKNNIGFKGKLEWTNLSSRRDNFQTQNLWDFNYGLTALINLPWELQFSTDITMFSHRGYDSHSMNRNDLVWNARLTRVFLNGKITCFIDGFDILSNLSNIQRYVNAQGRTETRYNVQPRYAMFHLVYRFAKQPKKR